MFSTTSFKLKMFSIIGLTSSKEAITRMQVARLYNSRSSQSEYQARIGIPFEIWYPKQATELSTIMVLSYLSYLTSFYLTLFALLTRGRPNLFKSFT